MEQQQPLAGEPVWPNEPTTPMPTHEAPPAPQGQYGTYTQYGPYYPPTVAQPAYPAWQPGPAARGQQPPTPRPARMPKEQAVAVTQKLKAALIAGSVMAFGVLTALAAGHVTGVTSQQSNAASQSNGSGATTQPATSNPSGSDDGGGFFNQAPSNTSGSSGGFGVSPNSPYQQPITGSSTS